MPTATADTASTVSDARTLTGLTELAGDAEAAERRFFIGAATYAVAHPIVVWTRADEEPETIEEVAGIDESAVAEFACATGRTYASGLGYLSAAKECATRLPRLWVRVLAGEVSVWRARLIADRTYCRNAAVAEYVDRRLAAYAHSCSFAQLDRTVAAAIAAHDPELAAAQAKAAADGRRVLIGTTTTGADGTVEMYATLDAADALDLDRALGEIAADLKAVGSEDSLEVRRSMALGELGRKQLTLDFGAPSDEDREPRNRRDLTLYVHLSQAALEAGVGIGRLENTRIPVTLDQIRTWCGVAGTKVVVRPVLDTGTVRHTDAYEATPMIREAVILRDGTCVAPYCTHSARGADLDHIQPFDHAPPPRGGPTSTANLAALCRRHHRLKTHAGWTYEPITTDDGTSYLWTLPSGSRYLRGPTGTTPLD
ncbi:HNH endonuclease signature motif containing protein [Nocardioides sp.]|uniref:HNH endonuclease signature motif containing protein n=1 Tax=Nocardioides sp. TaxID=35761 RepID=UPI003517AFE5